MLHRLRYTTIFAIFIILLSVVVIEFFTLQSIPYVDSLITRRINSQSTAVQVTSLKSKISLNLKKLSVSLSLYDLSVFFYKTSIKLPSLTLELDLRSLLSMNRETLIQEVTLHEHQASIYYKSLKNVNNFSLEESINNLKQSGNLPKKLNFKVPTFKLLIFGAAQTTQEITFNELAFKFINESEDFTAELSTGIKYCDVTLDLDTRVASDKEKILLLKGSAKNITNNIKRDTTKGLKSCNFSEPNFNVEFRATINNFQEFGNVICNFQPKFLMQAPGNKYDGESTLSEISKTMKSVQDAHERHKVNQFYITIGNANIKNYKGIVYSTQANTDLSLVSPCVIKLLNIWHCNAFPDLHGWLKTNVLAGDIRSISFKRKKIGDLFINRFSLHVKNLKVKCAKNTPMIYAQFAHVELVDNKLILVVKNGLFHNSTIQSLKAEVEDLSSENIRVHCQSTITGELQDQLNLISFDKKDLLIKGKVTSTVSFQIVPRKKMELHQLNLKLTAHISKLSLHSKGNAHCKLTNGDLRASCKNNTLVITGKGKLNGKINTDIFLTYCLEAHNKQYDLKITTKDDAKNYLEGGFLYARHVRGCVKVRLHASTDKPSSIRINLTEALVTVDNIGMQKPQGVSAEIFLELPNKQQEELVEATNFSLCFANQAFNGHVTIKNKIIHNVTGRLAHGDGDFIFVNYKLEPNSVEILISGSKIDLRKLNIIKAMQTLNVDKFSGGRKFTSNIRVRTITFDNDVSLDNAELEISYQGSRKSLITIKGLLNNRHSIHLRYSHPILSVASEDAGDFFRAISLANRISNGKLKIDGKFNDINQFDGLLLLEKFSVSNNPSLINSLIFSTPIASFKTIYSPKSMNFTTLRCPFLFDGHKIIFSKCVVLNKDATYKVEGIINTRDGKIRSKGTMAPNNILNKTSNKLSALGIFSDKRNEYAMVNALFDVFGNLNEDIGIKVDYLSYFIPVFLRNIFNNTSQIKPLYDEIK
jgi:hypothetical protein